MNKYSVMIVIALLLFFICFYGAYMFTTYKLLELDVIKIQTEAVETKCKEH
jgi:hypothetical protein